MANMQIITKGTIESFLSWQQSKAVWLEVRSAQQEIIHAWNWKPIQIPKTSKAVDLRGEPHTTTF